MKPIEFSQLIDAVDLYSEEHITRIDLQNGCVVTVERGIMGAVEGGDEALLEGMADWERQEVEIARAIANDSGERFLDAPDKYDFHEYRQMERFVETIENSRAAESLWRAIKGRGACRHFKDTADRLGLLTQWYEYRDEALKKFVRDWAEAHEIPIAGDMSTNASH